MENDQQIIPGDVVHLNSGSPDLTVESVDGDNVTVTWEGETGQEQITLCHVFRESNLTGLHLV